MTFIVVFVALLIERFFDCSHLRNWDWFMQYQQALLKRLRFQNPLFNIVLIMIPLLILLGLLQYVFHGWLYGLLSFILQLTILLYCLGPKNLWAESYASIRSVSFHPNQTINVNDPRPSQQVNEVEFTADNFLNSFFIDANRRIYAVLFWFVILGPIGILLYRLATLMTGDQDVVLSAQATKLVTILDWLPVRFMSFLFAFAGHYVDTFNCWRKHVALGLAYNEIMLTQCGKASLGSQKSLLDHETLEKNAIHLFDRVLIITVILLALSVIIAW